MHFVLLAAAAGLAAGYYFGDDDPVNNYYAPVNESPNKLLITAALVGAGYLAAKKAGYL